MRFCEIKMKDGTHGIIDLDKIIAIVPREKVAAPDHIIWMGEKFQLIVTSDEAETIERKLLK